MGLLRDLFKVTQKRHILSGYGGGRPMISSALWQLVAATYMQILIGTGECIGSHEFTEAHNSFRTQ